MTSQDPATAIGDAILSFFGLPAVQTGLRLAWLALIFGWACAILWASRDAWRRSGNLLLAGAAGIGMAAATPVFFLPAIPIWMLVRPQGSVADVEERRLTIAALRASLEGGTCPECRSRVNGSWRRCPWCRTWLSAPCPRCGRPVEMNAEVCPWCVADLRAGPLQPVAGPLPEHAPPPAAWRGPDAAAPPAASRPTEDATQPVAIPIVPDPPAGIPIQPDPNPDPIVPAAPARPRRAPRSGRTQPPH